MCKLLPIKIDTVESAQIDGTITRLKFAIRAKKEQGQAFLCNNNIYLSLPSVWIGQVFLCVCNATTALQL